MTNDMHVANTILAQLGGNMFAVLTGSRHFTGDANSLSFQVGANAKNVTHVKVTLLPSDTYEMTFLRFMPATGDVETLATESDVYCEQLQDFFETHTSLYTTLHARR